MLRVAIARSARSAGQGVARSARTQWQPQRIREPLRRGFAEERNLDKTVLPGSQSKSTAGVPQAPILDAHQTTPSTDIPPSETVLTPPTPAQVSATPPTPSTNTGNLPPTGTGTAATGPTSAPPPPKPRRRVRRFLTTLLLLSALSYAGGVYYSLVSDNFHDFFTEYIPYGEDAVAYFEEREFRKRFPSKEYDAKKWPQTKGETKVTIGRASGLQPRVAEKTSEDLGKSGRHVSAVEDGNKPQPGKAAQTPSAASPREKTQAVEAAKTSPAPPKSDAPKSAPAPAPPAPAPAPAQPMVDHMNVPSASEPVVQDLVKMVNNIITAINASPDASSKFGSIVSNLKSDLNHVVAEIGQLKDTTTAEAQKQIQNAHVEFDNAAKELMRRLEGEMKEMESRWRDEYENEREKLAQSYQARLQAEVEGLRKVAEEKNQNALLQQEIELQKQYTQTVKEKVEAERDGRLSKLEELSENVEELESLTSKWNEVVDSTLRTQHLQVAVEAVKAKVLEADHPTPFLNELVALKEVSKDDEVVNAAIASINPLAYQRGIPTPAHLIDRFRRVASEVRKASLLPEDAGIAPHAASAVLSRFMFQKKSDRGLPEGDDVEATLARTEVLLEEGDLDAAAREMNGLKGWAGVLSRDWVAETRRVLEVRQAVEVMATEARLQSLLVE